MSFLVNYNPEGVATCVHAEHPTNECNTERDKADDLKPASFREGIDIIVGTIITTRCKAEDILCKHCFKVDDA